MPGPAAAGRSPRTAHAGAARDRLRRVRRSDRACRGAAARSAGRTRRAWRAAAGARRRPDRRARALRRWPADARDPARHRPEQQDQRWEAEGHPAEQPRRVLDCLLAAVAQLRGLATGVFAHLAEGVVERAAHDRDVLDETPGVLEAALHGVPALSTPRPRLAMSSKVSLTVSPSQAKKITSATTTTSPSIARLRGPESSG